MHGWRALLTVILCLFTSQTFIRACFIYIEFLIILLLL